ncbi:spondin domain-containing protein [Limibacter armeniacum]|uniref:spondin domain-containing protein n=1 Tax=Limibacter armeniacum TaxID=466084 RepID=UPI002FE64749
MKGISKFFFAASLLMLFTQCDDDDNGGNMPEISPVSYTVTIENIMPEKMFFQSGVFNMPVGSSEAGPATPGNSFTFSFHAGLGSKLSFATMYGASNDLFYAPDGEGIELYADDAPISGDITNQIMLWDAGTEVNEEPGAGPNQPANGGPEVGEDENGTVQTIDMINDGYSYPAVADNIKVMIANDGADMFTVTIENLSGSSTPLAPGTFVVHTAPNPLFEEGQMAANGIEQLAEDGNPAMTGEFLEANTGYVSPLAPGVWVIHESGTMPLFEESAADFGEGLEGLAEDGTPADLLNSVQTKDGVRQSGIFNTPNGAGNPGPLLPGNTYSFTFDAEEGDYLSFATMLVETNDLFYAPMEMGIDLASISTTVATDITSMVMLWDAGTEVNEFPGAGISQPLRLNGGLDENGNVMEVDDAYDYPTVENAIRVTITPSISEQ